MDKICDDGVAICYNILRPYHIDMWLTPGYVANCMVDI